jgi:hypothetical protein
MSDAVDDEGSGSETSGSRVGTSDAGTSDAGASDADGSDGTDSEAVMVSEASRLEGVAAFGANSDCSKVKESDVEAV